MTDRPNSGDRAPEDLLPFVLEASALLGASLEVEAIWIVTNVAPAGRHRSASPRVSRVPLWIHGHTHHNVDYKIGATRIYSNQRGYPEERLAGFAPEKIIEIL